MAALTTSAETHASQLALTQLLLGCLVQHGAHHAVALGALMTLFRHLALQYPCCADESRQFLEQTLAELDGNAGPLHVPAPTHTH